MTALQSGFKFVVAYGKKKGFFGCVSKEEVMRKEKFANLHIGRCEQFEAENQCHISKQTFHMYQCAIFF